MKTKLLMVGILVLVVAILASYGESIVIMRGDYLFSRWVGVTETNKNWFHLFFWMIAGGSVAYILYRLIWRKKKTVKSGKGGETSR